MNWDRIEGNWKQAAGKVKEKWGKLTDDDITVIGGKHDQLIGRIQERYGIAKDEAERQVKTWAGTLVCLAVGFSADGPKEGPFVGEPAAFTAVIPPSITGESIMGRGALLWLLGVPIPVLLLMWVLGWLH